MTVQLLVAAEIRVAFARRNITYKKGAETLGLSKAQFSRRVNGHMEFSSTELAKLSKLLDTPVSTFFAEAAVA